MLSRVVVVIVWTCALTAVIYYALCFPLFSPAKDMVFAERTSPNNAYIATAFHRYGGATVNNTTVVTLRQYGERGNTKRNEVVFWKDGTTTVDVRWGDSEHLIIQMGDGEIYMRSTNWHGIKITYLEPDTHSKGADQ